MGKTFYDDEFRRWEAFASTGRFGLAASAYLIFHCLTDRGVAPRFVTVDGNKAVAERMLFRATPADLRELLGGSKRFDKAPDATPKAVALKTTAPALPKAE